MKKNQKIMSHDKPGFTLIELMIVVSIIGILVSVILVSMIKARERAQDNSILTSFKSMAAPTVMCLNNGAGVTLTAPTAGTNICSIPVGDSKWPDLNRYGWSTASGFFWCDVNFIGSTAPGTGAYDGISYGGNSSTGNFCFMLKKGAKTMWCSNNGCYKEGF